ncbi:MAG: dipeptidyl peptidase 3, partial [Paramuribaculum sp.]|nr:dipeptidyl peptidase 3 [Paramuribaculum sp.]
MMKSLTAGAVALTLSATVMSCSDKTEEKPFDYTVDRFADIEVLRYQVHGFEDLTLNQKLLIYYLTEAAITGRDMLWDQNGKYNLALRNLLEDIYTNYNGDKNDENWKGFETYMKQVWFANGIHHHYSMDKFTPAFSREWMEAQIANLKDAPSAEEVSTLLTVVFDPQFMAKRVNQAEGADLILTSANNLYEGVTQKEVEDYYNALKDTTDLTPVSWGLNTRVTKDENGNIVEQVYKVGGLYSNAITRIVELLNKASEYAENDAQRDVIAKLVDFYTTGSLKAFDDYSIAWADETSSQVDFINGFIESYGDPLGMTGAYESIVN